MVKLPGYWWRTFGLNGTEREHRVRAVSCALYLGYGLYEIQDLVADPARKEELDEVVRVAPLLGFREDTHLVVRYPDVGAV